MRGLLMLKALESCKSYLFVIFGSHTFTRGGANGCAFVQRIDPHAGQLAPTRQVTPARVSRSAHLGDDSLTLIFIFPSLSNTALYCKQIPRHCEHRPRVVALYWQKLAACGGSTRFTSYQRLTGKQG